MLSFAEEIYLLSLGDNGKISLCGGRAALHRALCGAVLCELAFLNRIDVDLKVLYVVDSTPAGVAILDDALEMLNSLDRKESIHFWLEQMLPDAGKLEQDVAAELVNKGILKLEETRVLWVFPSRSYPLINDVEVKDVKRRLGEIVLSSDELPTPRDTVLISLAYACDLFHEILAPDDLERCRPRIEALSKLDLLGQEIIREVSELPLTGSFVNQQYQSIN